MSTIEQEIIRLQNAKEDLKGVIENKGVAVDSASTLDSYSTYVGEIEYENPVSWYTMMSDEEVLSDSMIKSNLPTLGWKMSLMLTSIDLQKAFELGFSTTYINNNSFYMCSKLSSVTLSDNTATIGSHAFESCKISSIFIPCGCYRISEKAFFDCNDLETVIVTRDTPPELETNVFYHTVQTSGGAYTTEIIDNLTIYVPSGSVETYKAAANWSAYTDNIVAIPAQYRELTTGTTCVGNDLYALSEYQVSYNSGCSWETTATSATSLIEAECDVCISPPMKFIANYSDGSSYSALCDSNDTLSGDDTKPTGYTYSAMTSAIVGNCITTLSSNFNGNTSITSVTIGSGVTAIYTSCSGCTNLASVTLLPTTPPSFPKYSPLYPNKSFVGTTCIFYVPSESLNAYKSAWSSFSSRIQAIQ